MDSLLGGLLGSIVSWAGYLDSFLRQVTLAVSWVGFLEAGNLSRFLGWVTWAVSWAGALDAAQTRFF